MYLKEEVEAMIIIVQQIPLREEVNLMKILKVILNFFLDV
jgi:hypothetical protein